jgi:HK97 family phage portal protein
MVNLIDKYFPAIAKRLKGAPSSEVRALAAPEGAKAIHGTPIQTTGESGWRSGTPVNTMPGVIGVSPAANAALSISTVWACCRLISTSIATLPSELYEVTPDGKKIASTHPLYALLTSSPNPMMASQQWLQPTLLGLLIYGNGYSWVDRVNGKPVAIWPLNPARVHMVLNLDGTFSYYYSDLRGKFNVFTEADIIHFRLFTMDGYFGLPVLIYQQMTLGVASAATMYATSLYQNGGRPGGVLQYPGELKKEQVDRIRDSWNAVHGGPTNAGRIAILEEGMKYESIGIPPEQLQFIEEQKFSVEQIARIFGVPPHMIGAANQPTYASVEQQSIEFVRYTLYPYVRCLEQGVDKALLDSDTQWKINLDAFERGDISTRYASYAIGRQWGWLSPNEIRTKENLNTFEGGDDYLTPLNMVAVPAGQVPPPPPAVAPPKPPTPPPAKE